MTEALGLLEVEEPKGNQMDAFEQIAWEMEELKRAVSRLDVQKEIQHDVVLKALAQQSRTLTQLVELTVALAIERDDIGPAVRGFAEALIAGR